MAELVRPAAHELVQVYKLWYFLFLLIQTFEKWLCAVLDHVMILPVLAHFVSLTLSDCRLSVRCSPSWFLATATFLSHLVLFY